MKRSNNVLPFPSENPSGARLKLFAIIFYLSLAYLLTLGMGLFEDGLGALVILGILYNFFVRNRMHKSTYFKDNLLLIVILLVVCIIAFKTAMLLLLALVAVYWLLVGQSGREAPYFLRFHMLTALILNFFLLMPYLLLDAVLRMLTRLVAFTGLGGVVAPVASMVLTTLPLLFMGLIGGAAIWLSISAIMGRTPYIPIVTNNVRHWS